MKNIVLDGTNWKTKDDFYDAFFKAVGAPKWHGRNFNALRDSMINGQINEVEPPFTIQISGLSKMPSEVRSKVRSMVEDFCNLIREVHSQGHEVDVVCRG